MDRRLAAIMAAERVAYSRRVERDETGTLERLGTLRKEVFEPLIARYHGRIVKLTGDGYLVEFASVLDAVECALAWQGGLWSSLSECRQALPRRAHRAPHRGWPTRA